MKAIGNKLEEKKGSLQSCLCCEKRWEERIVKKVTKGVGGWGSEGHGTSPTLQMKDRGEMLRIRYKCLVPIYVFPEMKLLFAKQNYIVLSPSSYTHISVRYLYTSGSVCLFCCRGTDPWNIKISHRHINVEIGPMARVIPRKGIHKWDFPFSTVSFC
jgi:hypothetical protein